MKTILAHDDRPALSEFDREAFEEFTHGRGLPAFRGRQIYDALWKRGVQSIDEITSLPASLRAEIALEFRLRTISVRTHLQSAVDGAEKVLFALGDRTTVETVLIPSRGSDGTRRYTVCVSSQVGCPAACSFCATGLSGFTRNLTAAEIADQVLYFSHRLSRDNARVTNVVFMGMGEPLLNVPNVRLAISRLTDPVGLNMGDRRITVSTVGIVPQIRKFAQWAGQVNLAVSLHAPNDEVRTTLVPYNRHFPLSDVMAAVKEYTNQTGRRVSLEYVLLRGENDTMSLAEELATLVLPLGSLVHVNLIPWNPFREGRFIRSEVPDADRFAEALRRRGVNATIRYSKGLDISGACGQLREQVSVPANS